MLNCAGVPITACTPAEAAQAVVVMATSELRQGWDVHLCNAYTIALADKEPRLRLVLEQAGTNFPDGKSLVWANRAIHRGKRVPSTRVSGPELFVDVFALGEEIGLRHYLLGSTPEVLNALKQELRRRFPTVAIVGSESPPFRPLSVEEINRQVDRLVASRAQVVWIGLGTPKQDWEAARLAVRVPTVLCAVGAAFDFVAGTKKRAPTWMHNRGLEWLYRLASDPRRLWKRYLFGNVRFLFAVARRR